MVRMLEGGGLKPRALRIKIAVSILVVAVVFALVAVFAILHSGDDADAVRAEDLYSIPSCIPD